MFNQGPNKQQPGIGCFVPGYVSYSGIAGGLAAALYNLAEWMLQLRR